VIAMLAESSTSRSLRSSHGGTLLRRSARFAAWAAGTLSGGRLTTLTYHRVLPVPDRMYPDSPDAAAFEATMRMVRDLFEVVPLERGVFDLQRGCLSPRSAVITFDDGYQDNVTVALPILRRLGLTATFFISTGFLNGGRMWNDTIREALRCVEGVKLDLRTDGLDEYDVSSLDTRVRSAEMIIVRLKYLEPKRRWAMTQALAERAGLAPVSDLMMNDEQVRQLRSAGMSVGAHTVNHPILTSVSEETAKHEIFGAKYVLESVLDEPVSVFAYPNGTPGQDYARVHVDLVQKAGYVAACSTALGTASRKTDPLQLPRLTPWRCDGFGFRAQLIRNTFLTTFVTA